MILSLLDLNLIPTLSYNVPDRGDLVNPPPGKLYSSWESRAGRSTSGDTAVELPSDLW